MYGLNVERHSLKGSLSWHLARQLYATGEQGKVAVVTDKPVVLLSSTKKQWMKLARRIQNERASTLDAAKIARLTRQIAWMQTLRFSAKPPHDLLDADVTFAVAEDLVRVPPVCRTIYVTYEFDKEKLYMLTSWLPKGSTVIIYG